MKLLNPVFLLTLVVSQAVAQGASTVDRGQVESEVMTAISWNIVPAGSAGRAAQLD